MSTPTPQHSHRESLLPGPEGDKTAGQPLVAKIKGGFQEAYGSASHVTWAPSVLDGKQVILDYDPVKLSSFRVFFAVKGSIFHDAVLFTEQIVITILFFLSALPIYIMFNRSVMEKRKEGDTQTVRAWLEVQEPKMRDFAMIMMALCALLLTFYTSMAVGRWWTIRTQGVGGIKAAAVELEMYIGQLVTKDELVLSSIRRYARASLILVFLWRRKELAQIQKHLVGRELLDEGEVSKLLEWNHNLHETIWAWLSAIVALLYKEGKIKSDRLFELLLQRCSEGRNAVQVIHTHLAVRAPMQYVHLLGYLVKMHNLVLAIIMGMLFGAAIHNGEYFIMVMTFGRTLLLPLLFNAVLLINAELSDPFDGSISDFPGDAYEKALEKDGKAMVSAGELLPTWIDSRLKASPLM